MPNIGITELIIVLVVVLLILGPKRLPGLGRQLGGGMREFKAGIGRSSREDADEHDPAARRDSDAANPPGSQVADGDTLPERR